MGERVHEEFKSQGLEYDNFSSYSFDAGLLIAHSIHQMTHDGENFEDHTLLMSSLRKANFIGSTGHFVLVENSNNRASIGFKLYNVRQRTLVHVGK
mmetsp:Transcript_21095/g.23871  ORF Transcript_21095/g.23871 Transcript_21095/m.23871 type:complete len:96 (-) Transcript_21095:1703-1990(-)